MSIGIIICGIILCVAFSAFFSATEMALASANIIRLENEAKAGRKRAGTALKFAENFEAALSTILIANNLVNVAASSLATVLVIMLTGGEDKTWLATLIITVVVIIFGESIPKIVAKKNANRFAIVSAPVISVIRVIFFPVIWLVEKIVYLLTNWIKPEDMDEDDEESVKELQTIIETAEDEGVLAEDESERLQAAIEFNDIAAFEIMTSRVDMIAIDIDDDIEAIKQLAFDTNYSRIPVYEDSVDNIIGTIHLNHLFRALADDNNPDIRALLLEPVFVYKTERLPAVMDKLRASHQHLAIVTDEYAGTLGIVSLEDIMEQIVGDIWDESDEVVEEVVVRSEKEFELDADLSIADFAELIGVAEEELDCDSETVGGLVIEELEHFPEVGEKLELGNINITVLDAEERRVKKLFVRA